jgi:hypothetical protein
MKNSAQLKAAARTYCTECVSINESRLNDTGFDIEMTKYSEKWKNARNNP